MRDGSSVALFQEKSLAFMQVAQHRVHRTSAGCAHTFGIQPQTADSASGGFVRQIPPLPVTPAVGWQRLRAKPNTSLIRKVDFMFGSKIQNHFLAVAFFKVKFLVNIFFSKQVFKFLAFCLSAFISSVKFRVGFVESLK